MPPKMRSLIIGVAAALALTALPWNKIHADDSTIVLDDKTPSIDVIISTDAGASGAVSVEMQDAQLQLVNSSKAAVLSAHDSRITMLSLRLAEGAMPYVLHVQRLPGITLAQVKIVAQTTLPEVKIDAVPQVKDLKDFSASTVSKLTLAPAATLALTTTEAANLVTAEFAQGMETVQLSDGAGVALMTGTTGGDLNGIAIRLAAGKYTLNVINQDLRSKQEATLSLSQAQPSTLTALASPSAVGSPVAAAQITCPASISATANLRSGPGTAYTTMGYVIPTSKLTVGGVNKEKNWFLVQVEKRTAWITQSVVTLPSDCDKDKLTVFDIPLKNGVTQPPIIVHAQAQQALVTGGGAPSPAASSPAQAPGASVPVGEDGGGHGDD